MVALCRSMYHEPFWEKALGFAPMSQLCYSLLFSSMIVLAHHMCHFFWQKVSLWACSFVQCNFYRTNPRFWKWMDGIGFPICEPTYQGPINGWLFIDNHQASFVTMNHEVCQFLHLVLLRGHWGFIIVNTGISTNRYNWLEKRFSDVSTHKTLSEPWRQAQKGRERANGRRERWPREGAGGVVLVTLWVGCQKMPKHAKLFPAHNAPAKPKLLVPHIDVWGFLFLVLYPPSSASRLRLPSSSSLTHLTHSPHLTLTMCTAKGRMYALASLGLRLFCVAGGSDVRPGVPRAPPLLRGRRGTMCTAKGSDVRPGIPRAPLLLRGRCRTMCTAKGSDVRPGVPRAPPLLRGRPWVGQCALPRGRMYALASLGLRLFCVAGVGQCALPRGRMYALASLGLRLFCVAGMGQCALPRGRMYALASLGLRLFCVAGVGQCAMPRGRMYALASLGLRLFSVAGVGQCALPRGRMYALASLGLRLFCVAGVGQCALLRGRHGTMCTAKGSDVRPGVPLASLGLRVFCVAHSLARSLTHSLTTHSLIHSHSHSLTCACAHIHTYTKTHPPSPLHHSYTSSSLLAFLCSV